MNEKEIKVLEEFVANDQVLFELDPWLKNVNFFEIAKNAKTEELAAKPSSPSVKFNAFEAPTIINTTKTG